MESQHRKFIRYSINKTATDICYSYCNSSDTSSFCQPPCLSVCPSYCHNLFQSLIPSPSPGAFKYHINHKSRRFLIIIASILATSFFALLFYVIFVKFYLGSRRRSSSQPRIVNETHDDFLDEDNGPAVDHHIWYINTIGLQPSIISEITVLKYKNGDGLVEVTGCSVCLSEFQEDETLRLLPKCNHAFHISCIDTWLRSHTNCPLCRAPIVKNQAARASSSSVSNNENSGSTENTQVDILVENNVESETEVEDEALERRNISGTNPEAGELRLEQRRITSNQDSVEIQPIRRSVSLDSISAFKILQSPAIFAPKENITNSDTHFAQERDLGMKIVPKKVGRSEILLRFVEGSSIGRSLQNAPVSLKRSLSCSGKFLLSKSSWIRDPNFLSQHTK